MKQRIRDKLEHLTGRLEELDRALAEGSAHARVNTRIVERRSQPVDYPVAPGFPEGNYLKFVVLYRA